MKMFAARSRGVTSSELISASRGVSSIHRELKASPAFEVRRPLPQSDKSGLPGSSRHRAVRILGVPGVRGAAAILSVTFSAVILRAAGGIGAGSQAFLHNRPSLLEQGARRTATLCAAAAGL